MTSVYVYIVGSLFLALLDVIFSLIAFKKGNKTGFSMGMTFVSAAAVDLLYLGSVTLGGDSYQIASVLNSLYFISIDYLLVCFLFYVKNFGKFRFTDMENSLLAFCVLYSLIETVFFLINPLSEFVVSYSRIDSVLLPIYEYHPKLLFYVHLAYSYFVVALSVVLMLRRSFKVPKAYRSPYYFFPCLIIAIVLINALFLYIPGLGLFSKLDVSIWLYSLAVVFMFWHAFYFSKTGILNHFKSTLVDSLNQGIVLFDYNEELILYNDWIQEQYPKTKIYCGAPLTEFFRNTGILYSSEVTGDDHSFTCTSGTEDHIPLRCDYKSLKDNSGIHVGKLYVFTSLSERLDLLTGFIGWESFLRNQSERQVEPTSIAICDISGLGKTNSTLGRAAGDQLIRTLAEAMRDSFSRDTLFVRGRDASLIAISHTMDEKEALEALKTVRYIFNGRIQYGVSAHEKGQRVEDTIALAERAMNNRKLLDENASHSSILGSLVRALKESDPDTEAHVKRTREMSAHLAEILNLSDLQKSELDLLCLLHDIGKIGVPLEILNKPGRLTDEEFEILRSHVNKGYNIAVSSPEFSSIASLIQAHHERWDGYGYPNGIKGEQIPLLSRIISVVDAFDAMVSTRSYKPPMPREEALNEILRCGGSQFDPRVASAFVGMMHQNPQFGVIEESINGQSKTIEFPFNNSSAEKGSSKQPSTPLDKGTIVLPMSRYTLDNQFRIISMDENFESITGYSPADVESRNLTQSDIIPLEDRPEYLRLLNEQVARQRMGLFSHNLLRKDGSVINVLCFGRLFYDSAARSERSEIIISHNNPTLSLANMDDGNKLQLYHQLSKWDNEFRRDPITGLLTPEAFRSEAEINLIRDEWTTLLLLTQINTGSDEEFTSSEIQAIDRLFQKELRRDDLLSYLGNHRFATAIFFPRGVSETTVTRRIEEIKENLRSTVSRDNKNWNFSIGSALSSSELTQVRQLFDEAESNLH